ncbi:uncharacterized protein NFIA_011860 [Aspergillus fischeri NRRL 181]|uniref:Uncharacterized protein n=1 Tax=Neosartorya fischeri (strain ATCC 1020 / DSM 3700 / CBS 544.65 / FGSC A1164 / JCM 1740 / NRRL 181 / WB 181) TaxID=331117 RepID=A1D254_NEOFI|nr:uncharacterized protein NFIA_011860 [Aspergillus fischeri NRRL 181]EAW22497.1 hypothetical protein NFIA_011860 [Aspergillus fischeri NRRL 181]
MNIFRKLRGKASRSSRGKEPAPSAPATIAESKSVNPSPPPGAMHISEVKRSPTLRSSIRKPGSETQFITIMVANAKGAADYLRLYRLLQRETDYGSEFDLTGDYETDYLYDGYIYNVRFVSVPDPTGPWAANLAHVCLVLTYDTSSRESWDKLVAICEGMRSRSEDGVLSPYPFLATVIVAMGEGEGEGEEGPMSVSQGEAEAFATQRKCLFVEVSRRTGRGVCDAVGSLVERAHGARGQYPMDQEGEPQRYKRAQVLKALFSP